MGDGEREWADDGRGLEGAGRPRGRRACRGLEGGAASRAARPRGWRVLEGGAGGADAPAALLSCGPLPRSHAPARARPRHARLVPRGRPDRDRPARPRVQPPRRGPGHGPGRGRTAAGRALRRRARRVHDVLVPRPAPLRAHRDRRAAPGGVGLRRHAEPDRHARHVRGQRRRRVRRPRGRGQGPAHPRRRRARRHLVRLRPDHGGRRPQRGLARRGRVRPLRPALADGRARGGRSRTPSPTSRSRPRPSACSGRR